MSAARTYTRPVRVIIVAYHHPESLARCILGLDGSTEVTIVDNSSSSEVLRVAELTGASYLDPKANLGFGAGVNVALRRLMPGPPVDVLLLNPDAVFSGRDLAQLARQLHDPVNDNVAALSPALRGSDAALQRVMWPFPSPGRAWLEALGMGRFNRSPGFAVGAVLLLRWEAIHQVGLFDERFFLYAEETDWQRRARDLGWKSRATAELVADHVGGGSSNNELRRQALFHSGGEIYQRKWFGAVGWQLYRAAVLVGCLPRLLHPALEKRQAATMRLGLYVRGPRRVAGSGGRR